LQTLAGKNVKTDTLPVSFIGMNQIKVQQMLDRVGFR
jgi:iron(III) transport system substrate-binding protein